MGSTQPEPTRLRLIRCSKAPHFWPIGGSQPPYISRSGTARQGQCRPLPSILANSTQRGEPENSSSHRFSTPSSKQGSVMFDNSLVVWMDDNLYQSVAALVLAAFILLRFAVEQVWP